MGSVWELQRRGRLCKHARHALCDQLTDHPLQFDDVCEHIIPFQFEMLEISWCFYLRLSKERMHLLYTPCEKKQKRKEKNREKRRKKNKYTIKYFQQQ